VKPFGLKKGEAEGWVRGGATAGDLGGWGCQGTQKEACGFLHVSQLCTTATAACWRRHVSCCWVGLGGGKRVGQGACL
jgi:hypothetical protein